MTFNSWVAGFFISDNPRQAWHISQNGIYTRGSTLVVFPIVVHPFRKDQVSEQQTILNDMNQRAEFDEELLRKYRSLIDLEEMILREKVIQN